MGAKKPDFSGWGTKANLRCSDGVTIMPGAFRGQDQAEVPLVWMHGHNDPTNVLGHAILEERDEGVYVHAFFNETPKAQHAKESVRHRDIKYMSIWANELVKRGADVLHGKIKEISLVLAGANPGALIENVMIAHGDGYTTPSESDATITTGTEIVIHADDATSTSSDNPADAEDRTFGDVIETMDEDQKNVFYATTGELVEKLEKAEKALADAGIQHSDEDDTSGTDIDDGKDDADDQGNAPEDTDTDAGDKTGDINDQTQEGNDTMSGTQVQHSNVFEDKKDDHKKVILSKEAKQEIFHSAMTNGGSMAAAFDDYCIAHGIDQMDVMFPDAKDPNGTGGAPQFIKRNTVWVEGFMRDTTKQPFSKIRNRWADITEDEARARGYITGNLKKDEFFGIAKRVTNATTVYKKQKLDRDDKLEITDFDVVAWLKLEMRLMLEEEVARAALIGDGRDIASEDKIDEQCIRPIAKEHDLFATKVNVDVVDAGNVNAVRFLDAAIRARKHYRGSGAPNLYTTEDWVAEIMLLKDDLGRDLYESLDKVAMKLRVREIITVEVMESVPDLIGILVDPRDYTFGANAGGEVTLFDQFDIDYNKEKYLIETRVSGSLTKPRSAVVFRAVESSDTLIDPIAAPAMDDNDVTIPAATHHKYFNEATGTEITDSVVSLDPAEALVVVAVANTGYYFIDSVRARWIFRGAQL